MNKLLQMGRYGFSRFKCISDVHVQTVRYIDQFPVALPFASLATSDLASNEDDAVSTYKREQIRLHRPDEAVVMPVNQVAMLNCLGKVHPLIPVY